jgi:hypothetical protein
MRRLEDAGHDSIYIEITRNNEVVGVALAHVIEHFLLAGDWAWAKLSPPANRAPHTHSPLNDSLPIV